MTIVRRRLLGWRFLIIILIDSSSPLIPVMSRLMSPGYSLLDDDATEDSVFYRLLYDHTTGAA